MIQNPQTNEIFIYDISEVYLIDAPNPNIIGGKAEPKAKKTPSPTFSKLYPYYPSKDHFLGDDASTVYLYNYSTNTLKTTYPSSSSTLTTVYNVP